VALATPVLLWICVRCAPVFAAGGSLVIATAIIWSTTFNLGHFGDATIPLGDRILAAQTLILVGAMLALIIAALFAERRRSELTLQRGNERLQLALNAAELGTFSADLGTGDLQCDARAAMMHGHLVPPTSIKASRRFINRDDLVRMDAALAKAKRTGGGWKVEYRVVHPTNHPLAGETRWIEVESSLVRKPPGSLGGLLGVTRDITARKVAEQALAERDTQLALAGRTALVGSFAFDLPQEECRYRRDTRPFMACPRVLSKPAEPNGELGSTQTTCFGWRPLLRMILLRRHARIFASIVLFVRGEKCDGSKPGP